MEERAAKLLLKAVRSLPQREQDQVLVALFRCVPEGNGVRAAGHLYSTPPRAVDPGGRGVLARDAADRDDRAGGHVPGSAATRTSRTAPPMVDGCGILDGGRRSRAYRALPGRTGRAAAAASERRKAHSQERDRPTFEAVHGSRLNRPGPLRRGLSGGVRPRRPAALARSSEPRWFGQLGGADQQPAKAAEPGGIGEYSRAASAPPRANRFVAVRRVQHLLLVPALLAEPVGEAERRPRGAL